MTDEPDRICGQRTESGNYCDKPEGDCPWHDAPGTDEAVEALLTDALDYHEAGEHAYAEKFVRRALDAL